MNYHPSNSALTRAIRFNRVIALDLRYARSTKTIFAVPGATHAFGVPWVKSSGRRFCEDRMSEVLPLFTLEEFTYKEFSPKSEWIPRAACAAADRRAAVDVFRAAFPSLMARNGHWRVQINRAVYGGYIHSLEWWQKKRQALNRDNRRCTRCGSKKKLHVHHLTYERFGDELLEDLETLCEVCHAVEHGGRRPRRKLTTREKWAKLYKPWIKADRDRFFNRQ